MKFFAAILLTSATLAQVAVCRADTFKRSEITGVLYVDGDTSQSDFYQSSATVGPGREFTGESFNGSAGYCGYVVNFSAAKVSIKDTCSKAISLVADFTVHSPTKAHDNFEMSFTDPALAGDMITPINNGLGLSYDAVVVGDTITFDLTNVDATTNRSTFAITSAVTPEPASWQLLILGLGGMLGVGYVSKRNASRQSLAQPLA